MLWIVGQPTKWGRVMARLVDQLTETKIRTLTTVGFHADGRGLYLQIRPGGRRSWIFRFTLNRRTRDMGLGSLTEVSLVNARAKAADARSLVIKRVDPIDASNAVRVAARSPIAEKSP